MNGGALGRWCGEFFDRAVAFAGFAVSVIEGLTEFPGLPVERPAGPGVEDDAFAVTVRAALDEFGFSGHGRAPG